MKTASLARLTLVLLLPAFIPAFTASAAVTLTGTNLIEADVSNFLDSQTKTDAPTALPYLNTVTALADDDSSSTTANLSNSAFILSFNQIASFSKVSGKGDLFFTVSNDTQYNLTGQFGADDATFGLNLSATLLDTSNPESPLYHSAQAGSYNSAKSFTLGGSEGTSTNELSGSPTGTLVAGKTYELIVNAGFEAPTDPTGTGTVTLAFAPITGPGGGGPRAPLPPAIWVGTIFATGLLAWKHRTASRKFRTHFEA